MLLTQAVSPRLSGHLEFTLKRAIWCCVVSVVAMACLQPVAEGGAMPGAAEPDRAAQPTGGGQGTAPAPAADAGNASDAGQRADCVSCGNDLLVFGGNRPWPTDSGQGGANGSAATFRIDLTTRRVSEVGFNTSFGKPPARLNHVAAWDAAAQRMLVFGGSQEELVPADVWTLEFGSVVPRWRRLLPSGPTPSARNFAASAFDPVRRKWYVGFGQGAFGTSLKSDFFVFDAATNQWSQLSNDGPPPRACAAMAVDPATGIVVLSGGLTGGPEVFSDVWTWDPAAPGWKVATASPVPLAWHLVFPDLSPIVLFGGVRAAHPSTPQEEVLSLTLGPPATWGRIGLAPEAARGILSRAATVNGVGYAWNGEHTGALWRYEVERGHWSSLALSGAPDWLEGFSIVGRGPR